MKKIGELLGAVFLGGGLVYLGYLVLTEGAVTGGGRRGGLIRLVINGLVDALGQTPAGVVLVGLGVVVGGFLLYGAVTGTGEDDEDDEE